MRGGGGGCMLNNCVLNCTIVCLNSHIIITLFSLFLNSIKILRVCSNDPVPE